MGRQASSLFGHGVWGWGRGRSAGTLSSRHVSPAACLTPFALLFPLFLGVRGYIRLHLVIQRALCLRRPQQGGKGSQSIGKTLCPFLLELEKKIGRQRVPKKKKKPNKKVSVGQYNVQLKRPLVSLWAGSPARSLQALHCWSSRGSWQWERGGRMAREGEKDHRAGHGVVPTLPGPRAGVQ